MPELPEVEIIKRGLKSVLIGKKISDLSLRSDKIFLGDSSAIIGSRIDDIRRHAKMLEIDLSNGLALLIHLKMTGQLVYDHDSSLSRADKSKRIAGGHPSSDWVADLPNKFTHVIFEFAGGGRLYFNDLRKFGYIKVYKQSDLLGSRELKDIGPNPFTEKLNAEYLMEVVAKRPKIKIKQLLMDQTVIAGIGNIYADESLFCAKISPLRLAGEVKRTEFLKLIDCIRSVLGKAIKMGGSSENTFVHADGQRGRMQNHFNVYRRTGLDCPRGCAKIKRVVVGGRGTHYCPGCQK